MNNGKILVMDDEEVMRYIYTRMLNRIHYDVVVAEDGNEAIELFERAIETNNPFDVTIMDLKVANGMGGEKAIKKLLEIDTGAKIIMSSGSVSDHVMINYKKYGISARLCKPFKIDDLKKVLKQVTSE